MTPIFLLEALELFIKEKTKDILLQVCTIGNSQEQKMRAADIYKMDLPTKEDGTQKIPYILLQFLTGKDDKQEREPEESICQIRIVVGTYSKDAGAGKYDVLNILLRLRSELKKAGVIGEYFTIQNPLEYLVYPDSNRPYYFGEMMTNWSIPVIKREIEEIWQ